MKRTFDDLINGNCRAYDVFERGLTEEEFKQAREKMMKNTYQAREKIKDLTYENYYEWTHIMTKDGIKVKPVEITDKELQCVEMFIELTEYFNDKKILINVNNINVISLDQYDVANIYVGHMSYLVKESYSDIVECINNYRTLPPKIFKNENIRFDRYLSDEEIEAERRKARNEE